MRNCIGGKMMKNNLEYFNLATEHKEELLDENYHKKVERKIIPTSYDSKNNLTLSNKLFLIIIRILNAIKRK